MMDTVSELLFGGLARTTLCTTLATLATLLLLPTLGIRSTRIHRAAWVLVILQGWILMPLTFTVSASSVLPTEWLSSTSIDPPATSPLMQPSAKLQAVELSLWQRYGNLWQRYGKQTVTAAWLIGTLAVLGFYFKRYYSLVTHIPLGSAPESEEWKDEWQEVADGLSPIKSSPQKNVHFRVTNRVGPLLCYVPWVYLVLVPQLLWASLSRNDRLAILRHELAHLQQGDLWKNVAIRVLALPQWFNPFVWLAIRRFEEAGEWACDEAVLASSTLANTGYANTLLRVAGFSANAPCGAVAASGGVLTRRVTRLLASSDKEVSKMKNFFVLLLLLGIAAGQAIRIESVRAEAVRAELVLAKAVLAKENASSALAESRAETVAKWRTDPYVIEPPNVLAIELVQGSHRSSGNKLKTSDLGFDGKHLVGPDGRVNLGDYGSVFVAGMTVAKVRAAIEKQLALKMKKPEVLIDVLQHNSRVVYVIQKRDSGDNVARIPCTKELNVLKVLQHVIKAPDIEDHAYILWPGKHGKRPANRLEIDLEALLTKSDMKTNYDLLPGDRIFYETRKATNTKQDSSKPSPVPPSRVYSHPYSDHSALPDERTKELTPLTVGKLVFLRFEGDTARRLMLPLKKNLASAPGLQFDIVAKIVAINSEGHLKIETNQRITSEGKKLRHTISISGVVRPVDVGPNRYVNSEDIAFLEIEVLETKDQ